MIYTHEERKAWDAYDDAMRRVRNVLTHFGVADCDDPLAALEEVPERADAVVDDEVAHANELTLQVAALRAIIEGRTTPPTFAEVDALAKDGGAFRYRTAEGGVGMVHTRHDLPFALGATEGVVTTWWAHDADRRPCAWPVVQEPAR